MKQRKGKKNFFNKKNLMFAIALVLIASIAVTFFVSCNNGKGPDPVEDLYNQPSTMLETPTDGSTPADHDAKDNAYYALYAMNALDSFTVDVAGETVSKVAFANVSQKIKGYRVVNGSEIYKENVSHSSFRSVGVRTFVKNGNYVARNAKKVSSIDNVVWENSANRLSKESFLDKFGYVPNSPSNYILTDETILSAQYLGEENGVYSFYYELDPVKSTSALSIEMRTMAGNDSLPVFEKAAITIKVNKDWQITQIVTSSVYRVDMLGGITCTESVVETFGNFNQGVAVPDSDFYNTYVDAEITEPAPVTLTATDYLTAGFADYITGIKPLKLSANIVADKLSANLDAVVALNMEDLAATSVGIAVKDATYQDINIQNVLLFYQDSQIYLNAGDFKAKTSIDEVSAVANEICELFGLTMPSLDGVDLSSMDLETLLGGATLQETDTLATVTIPLTFGDTTINAQMVFTKGDQIAITQISATIGEVQVAIAVDDDVVVPQMGEGYHAITPLLQAIAENIAVQVEVGDITAVANINLKTFEVDAVINDLTISGATLGDIKAKLVGSTVYADVMGLKVKLDINNAQALLDKLPLNNIRLPDLTAYKNIDTMALVAEIINSLSTNTTQENLSFDLTALGLNFNVVVDITQDGYSLGEVAVNVEGNNIKASLYDGEIAVIDSADLANYNDVSTLLDIVEENQINLAVRAFGLDIDVNINLVDGTVLAKTTIYGQPLYAKLADNKVYVSYKGLNGFVNLDDAQILLDKLGVFVGEISLPDFSAITAQSVINSVTVTDSELITISLNIAGISAEVVLDKTNGLQVAGVTATVEDQVITASPATKADYSGMAATEYYNLVSLLDIIDANGKISLKAQLFDTTVYATLDLPNNQILVALDSFEILVDLSENVAYARYPGVNLKLNLDEISVVLSELQPIITRFISQEEFESINLDSFKNISVQEVVSSILVTETDIALNVSLAIADINATLLVDKTQNGLSICGGNVKMGAIDASFETGVAPLDFAFDKTANYIGVTELVQTFAPALKNILTLDNLYANMTATLVLGNTIYELTECEVLIANIYSAPKASANVTLKITTNNADGTTKVSEHKITLVYLDPTLVEEGQVNTYFTYDDTSNTDVFAGTFTTVNFYETLDIVKQIYANMPELQEALKPFIVADENSMPQFMDLEVDFSKLINSAFFADGILSVDANAKAILSDLSNSVWLNLFSQDGLLCLDVDNLAFDKALLSLDARVGEAPSGVITEDKFEFTPLSTASDFSSINELLLALQKTSQKRHFYIDAKVDLAGTGLLSLLKVTDKIFIKIYLDVIDGKTYFKAIVERQNVNLVLMDVWSDYDGTSYIYFDPDTQLIYVHNHYRTKGGSWLRPTYTEHDEYIKYTTEQFAQDPLTAIFDILHISSDLTDIINSESAGETKVSTATIDNTFKSYSYNGNDTFNITLDLAPLTTDIKTATVAIKHDAEYNLTALNVAVNMISILDLKLSATLQTSDVSYGTDVEAKAIALDPNFN